MQKRLPVRTALLTGFPLAALATVGCTAWGAEGSLSLGFSDLKQNLPTLGFSLKNDWSMSVWEMTGKIDGKLQHDHGLGDADTNVELHAERPLAPTLKLELDAEYDLERTKDADRSVEQSHYVSGDVGVEKSYEHITLKTDVGTEFKFHEDTRRRDLPPLDRSDEDFFGGYLSAHLTFLPEAKARPFLEAAFVGRDYRDNDGEGFTGPDIVLGYTFEQPNLTGDLGVIMSRRTTESGVDLNAIGPYAELKWTPSDVWSFNMDLTTGIEQDAIEQSELFRFYEGKLQVIYTTEQDIKLSALVSASLEDHHGAKEKEITPKLRVEWQHRTGLHLFGRVGLKYSKEEDEPAKHEPSVEVGMKMVF